MENEWYYGQHDQQLGPVSIEELKALAAAGQLARTDIVWTEGFDDWIAAAEVEGLSFPMATGAKQLEAKVKSGARSAVNTVRSVGRKVQDVAQSEEVQSFVKIARRKAKEAVAKASSRSEKEPIKFTLTLKTIAIAGCGLLLVCITIGYIVGRGSGTENSRASLRTKRDAEGIPDYVPEYAKAKIRGVGEDVKAGDRHWDADQKPQAIEKYMAVLNSSLTWHVRSDLPRVYGRLVDYKVEQNDISTAQAVARKAAEQGLVLSLQSPQGQQLFSKATAAVEAERLAQRQKEAKSSRGKSSPRSTGGKVDIKLVTELKPGMSESTVRGILGNPHETKSVSMQVAPTPGTPFDKAVRTIDTWTYNPNSQSFIVLLFERGILTSGGSGGWDIKTGLIVSDKMKKIFRDSKKK